MDLTAARPLHPLHENDGTDARGDHGGAIIAAL
jgi:hypothetical protein